MRPKRIPSLPEPTFPVAQLPYWQWLMLSWTGVIVACFLFSCSPALFFYSSIPLSPAYELKSQHPFAETSALTEPPEPSERSHGAKLTRRLTGAFILFATTKIGISYYWPATVGGAVLLLSAIILGERLTHDRLVGVYLGLTIAGLYVTNACFSLNVSPKPFDGIAIGLIAAAFIVQRPYFQIPLMLLACWADERALLGIVCLAAFANHRNQPSHRSTLASCLKYASVIAMYALSRLLVEKWFRWQPADMSMVGDGFASTIPYTQLAAWTGLEGGLILLAFAIVVSNKKSEALDRGILALLAGIALFANLMVLDISRGAAFSFPLIFLSLGVLNRSLDDVKQLRRVALASAIVSLLCPNFEVMAGIIFRPLPSLPLELFLRWSNSA